MREVCYQCFWPKRECWCPHIKKIPNQTKFIFLMHPKEFKYEKAGTGRLTHLSLTDSEILMGVGFDDHYRMKELLTDPQYYPMVLYPGERAVNLSKEPLIWPSEKKLLLFLLDGTWSCAKKMMKLSTCLHDLPRLSFEVKTRSKFLIKQQPQEYCLSTLEAVHEVMNGLSDQGVENYPEPDYLLDLFLKMQEFQMKCASDPERQGYRHRPYKKPEERVRVRKAEEKRKLLF
jgi:DTW domain-containing protein